MSHELNSTTVGSHVRAAAGTPPQHASTRKFWTGLSRNIQERIADDWERTREAYAATRQQHYFSAEFLMGRALLNNLTNLGLVEEAQAATRELGHELADVLEIENDAALGNGGLGRLAACFLDSAVTQDYPVTGYGILTATACSASPSTTASRWSARTRGAKRNTPLLSAAPPTS